MAIAADGHSLIYTPAPGYRGTDSFHYTVDGVLQAEVQVSVGALAVDDYYAFFPDSFGTTGSLDVLNNDHFWQHYPGPGIITAVGNTTSGALVSISEDGKHLLFTPTDGQTAQFTYTVDGKYQALVTVSFYNCLWSDSFVVDQNSSNSVLTPLNNDFVTWKGVDWSQQLPYTGQRIITAATAQGGAVTIAADGKSLIYSPARDFSGTDKIVYTVDGIMQETITVQVIRRVRDDVFHVERGSWHNFLPVLINDLFGADYKGAGLITNITQTEAGGIIAISADGKSIRYTPPAGFKGTDRFTYTVDGRLKAETIIYVETSQRRSFRNLAPKDALKQFLLAEALKKYDQSFGQEMHESFGICFATNSIASDLRIHSDTNVQVAGVDEGDIVENDGSYLYVLTGGKLVICRAWPAEEMQIVSQQSIVGTPIAEYLHGDRLTVISQKPRSYFNDTFSLRVSLSDNGILSNDSTIAPNCPYPIPTNAETIVTVYDVSNRAAPKIVEVTAYDGRYIESRRIDDKVFLVLRNDRINFQLPAPIHAFVPQYDNTVNLSYENPLISSGTYIPKSSVYESREDYVQRMMRDMDSIIDSMLPHFSSFGPNGEILKTGVLHQPEDITQIGSNEVSNLLSVVSMDISDNKPGMKDSTGILTSGASVIYGTLDNLYLFDEVSKAEDGVSTQILQFDWDAHTGKIHLAAKGRVAGKMLNQFSADECDGNLRIATTISNSASGNWSNRSENVLFVLRNDGGVLETVGGLQNLALDESIRSVRFLGTRAFITTFRDIDPLFALDLSDPSNPRSCGHVTMPGFNSYMQLIDQNHILAVGRNSPAELNGPTQITLFDIQDLTQPHIIDSYTFERFSTSIAETDHHAFGWFAEHQMLAMPTTRTYWERVDANGDGYFEGRRSVSENRLVLFKIDVSASQPLSDGIKLLGDVEHNSTVRRGAFIDNVLYSIADTSIRAVSILDPTIHIASVDLNFPLPFIVPPLIPLPNPDPIVPVPVPVIIPVITIVNPFQGPVLLEPTPKPITDSFMTPIEIAPQAESHIPWTIISGANLSRTHFEFGNHLNSQEKVVHWEIDEAQPARRFNSPTKKHAELPKHPISAISNLTINEENKPETKKNHSVSVFDQNSAFFDLNHLHEEALLTNDYPLDKKTIDKKIIDFLFANQHP